MTDETMRGVRSHMQTPERALEPTDGASYTVPRKLCDMAFRHAPHNGAPELVHELMTWLGTLRPIVHPDGTLDVFATLAADCVKCGQTSLKAFPPERAPKLGTDYICFHCTQELPDNSPPDREPL